MIVAEVKINSIRTAFVEIRNGYYFVNDGVGYVWASFGKPFLTVSDAVFAMYDAIAIKK